MRIALIRHPAVAVAEGVCYGRTDVALSDSGRFAIPGIVAALSHFAASCVWTSPARRCVAVAEALGGTIRQDARLLELDFGAWEGMRWDDVPRDALDAWAAKPARFAPPGGENVAALLARVTGFAKMLRAEQRDCTVVTHGGVLKLLRPLLRGETPDPMAPAPAMGSVEIISESH
jgi:alpha-ribazole phosphatase